MTNSVPNQTEGSDESSKTPPGQIESAIIDAQNLVTFTAKSGIDLDEAKLDEEQLKAILTTLISAKNIWGTDEWTPEFEWQFWEAFRQMNQLIKPATVASINMICLEPKREGFKGFIQSQVGRSEASRIITRYTVWTIGILFIVLFFQIYWVIGNSLSIKLTELIDSQTAVSDAIHEAVQDLTQLEVLHKSTEESGDSQGGGGDELSDLPIWERETLQLDTEQVRLEKKLAVLQTQLERNSDILVRWSIFWQWIFVINEQIPVNEEFITQIAAVDRQIDTADEPLDEEAVKQKFDEEENKLETKEEERVKLDQILNHYEKIFALNITLAGLDSESDGQLNQAQPGENEDTEIQSGIQQESSASDQTANVRTSLLSEIVKNQTEIDKISETLSQVPTDNNQTVEARNQVSSDIDQLNLWLAKNNLENIINERKDNKDKLEAEKAALERLHIQWVTREASHRVRLSTNFILIILQSYLLPVLYGLLGASVFVLRTITREISDVTYSADRSHLLSLALGTLSGLIIGWFVFLLPGQSVVSSISPFALAFLVGYNTEIVFSLMDRLIAIFTKPPEEDQAPPATSNKNQTNGDQAESPSSTVA